jgi:hypothetical protein
VAIRRADIADLKVRDLDELVLEVERLAVERDELLTFSRQLLADCERLTVKVRELEAAPGGL